MRVFFFGGDVFFCLVKTCLFCFVFNPARMQPFSRLPVQMPAGRQQPCCASFPAKDAARQHAALDAPSASIPVPSFPAATIPRFLTTETLCFYIQLFNNLVVNAYQLSHMSRSSGRHGLSFELPVRDTQSLPWLPWCQQLLRLSPQLRYPQASGENLKLEARAVPLQSLGQMKALSDQVVGMSKTR